MTEQSYDITEYTSLEPIVKKDTLLTLSYGAYEDYTVSKVYLVNVDFNIEEVDDWQ